MSDKVTLAHGGSLTIRRERVGRDGLTTLSIRARLQMLLPEYALPGGYTYQIDFADLVTHVEGVEDINYQFPPWNAPDLELAEGFELWLSLPEDTVSDMREALKPPKREAGAADDNPLHVGAKRKSEKTSATG